jgi:hypothetical protein
MIFLIVILGVASFVNFMIWLTRTDFWLRCHVWMLRYGPSMSSPEGFRMALKEADEIERRKGWKK